MSHVAANIITGFLGVGKTTAIRHLLANKPEQARWAVLVNEFGEVGVDGAILSEQGALVKEVPGGCMCCVAGLPMTVGLNTLLAQKPDRILIEPTGWVILRILSVSLPSRLSIPICRYTRR